MSSYDDELQRKFDKGETVTHEDADSLAYKHVFRALNSEVSDVLPRGLADRVIKIVAERNAKESRNEMWAFVAGVVLLFIAFAVAIAFTGFNLDFGFLKQISSYTGVFIFGAAFIIGLNYLEKKVLRKQSTS